MHTVHHLGTRLLIVCTVLLTIATVPAASQQDPTDLVNLGIATTDFRVGRAATITLQVENRGPAATMMAMLQVQVIEGTTPVFQDQVEMGPLQIGEVANVDFPTTWTPENPGPYLIQSFVAFNEDTDPQNNEGFNEILVAKPFLSLDEAVAILISDVISGSQPGFWQSVCQQSGG